MRIREYDPAEDPGDWEEEYAAWMAEGEALRIEQETRRIAYDAELRTVARLTEARGKAVRFRDRLGALGAQMAELEGELGRAGAAVALLEPQIAEVQQAREAATARLLGDVHYATPLVLLPVRVETRWADADLRVRIFPEELHVDSHETGLTADEQTWGNHWWTTEAELRLAAWRQLAERFGVRRAAWIVSRTDPALPAARRPESRAGRWTRAPLAQAMPDRWAVIGLVGDEPVLSAWSAPVRDPLLAGPSPEQGITSAAGNDWLVNFSAAEAAGMAVTIPLGDRLPRRYLDALIVLGLRTGPDEDATATLSGLLEAHHYTRGLGVLVPGAPTNNTSATRSQYKSRPEVDRLYDVERGDSLSGAPAHAGARVARLLGVDAAVFAHVEGADGRDELDMTAMQLALGVAGGAVRDRLVSEAGSEETEALWNRVRPAGCVPPLRVGDQPYGVLPATALSRWTAADSDPSGAGVGGALRGAFPRWRGLARSGLPRRSWADPLADVLTEHAASSRFTLPGGEPLAYPDATVGAPGADGRPAEQYLETIAAAAPDQLRPATPGEPPRVPPILLARLAAAAKLRAAPSDVPSVDGALRHLATLRAETLHDMLAATLDSLSHRPDGWVTALARARLQALQGSARVLGAYGVVHLARPRATEPQTEGYVHAPSLGQAATSAVLRSGYSSQQRTGSQADPLAVNLSSDRVRKALWLLDGVRHGQSLTALLGYRFERTLTDAGGLEHYIAEFRKLVGFRGSNGLSLLHAARRESTADRIKEEGVQAGLAETAQLLKRAIDPLVDARTTAEGLRNETLAVVQTYRGHVTAANEAAERATNAGTQLSDYDTTMPVTGDDLVNVPAPEGKRDSRKPKPLNSYAMKTWHEARKPLANALADAVRVRDALAAVVTVEAAQKAEAEDLLFRRNTTLTDADNAVNDATDDAEAATDAATEHSSKVLARKLEAEQQAIGDLADELRRQWAQATTTTAVTAVVDGLELRRRFRAAQPDAPDPTWDVTTIPFPLTTTTATDELGIAMPARNSPDFQRVLAVLRDLDDHVDAVSDLLVAEGVHQLVQANPTRAGGALDAIASGHVPADIDVVRTPRPGVDVSHRVAIVLDRARPPRWRPDSVSYRARVEPALDAWASHVLPDPAGVLCTATIAQSVGGEIVRSQRRELTLDALGLSALDYVYLTQPVDEAQQGELEQRIAQHVVAAWYEEQDPASPAWIPPDQLVLSLELDPRGLNGGISAAELMDVAGALRQTIADARPLSAADLDAGSTPSHLELATRVATLRSDVSELSDRLTATLADLPTAADRLAQLLFDAARLGLPEAVPPVLSNPGGLAPAALSAQGQSAIRLLGDRLAAYDGIAVPEAAAVRTDHDRRVSALLERAKALLGRDMSVLPELSPGLDPLVRDDLAGATSERLGISDRSGVRRWLEDIGRVRPAIARLLTAFGYAEALQAGERLRLQVTQLPPDAADRWVGLPALEGKSVRAGRMSVIVHLPENGVPDNACGLVIDEWTETVPGATHLTGLAFHCDQTGSTPPQAILIGVPPDVRPDRPLGAWDLDTLTDTIVETLDLARLRATAPDRLAPHVQVGASIPSGLIDPAEVAPP